MSNITLVDQIVVGLSNGDVLVLPSVVNLGNKQISLEVTGSGATLSPASGESVDGVVGNKSLGSGNYILSTTGGPGATWTTLLGSTGSSGPTTPVTVSDETSTISGSRRLVDGTNTTIDTSTPGQIKVNATGGGGSGNVLLGPNTATSVDITGGYTIGQDDRWTVVTTANAYDIVGLPATPNLGDIHYLYNDSGETIRLDLDGLGGAIYVLHNQVIGVIYSESGAIFGGNDYSWRILESTIASPNNIATDGVLLTYPSGNTEYFHLRSGDSTTSGNPSIYVNFYDPGVSGVQAGFVHSSGGQTGQLPFWTYSGVTSGGRFLFNDNLAAGDKRFGTATTSGGTVTVNTTAVSATSLIFLTPQHSSATTCTEDKASRVNGTSFVIKTGADCDVAWMIVEP